MPLQIFARSEASRKPDIGGITGRRLVDVGAAGIRQAEHPGDLVVRLARRVVNGRAELDRAVDNALDLKQ